MDDRNRAVRAVYRPQERQHDRVVSAERDHARVVLSVLRQRHERLARQRVVRQRRVRRAVQQLPVPLLDLLDRERVVVGRHRDVAAVDDLQPGKEGVHLQRDVVPPIQRQAARPRTDTCRPETCSGPVRCASILWTEALQRRVGNVCV